MSTKFKSDQRRAVRTGAAEAGFCGSDNRLPDTINWHFIQNLIPSSKTALYILLLLWVDNYTIWERILIACCDGWYVILIGVYNADNLQSSLLQ